MKKNTLKEYFTGWLTTTYGITAAFMIASALSDSNGETAALRLLNALWIILAILQELRIKDLKGMVDLYKNIIQWHQERTERTKDNMNGIKIKS